MSSEVAELAELAAAVKTLAYVPDGWAETPYKNSTRLELLIGLMVEGVVRSGLALRCTAIKEQPDRDVTFQVEWEPQGRKRLIIERLDLRPLRPHNNKALGPPEYRFLPIAGSHHHAFAANAPHGVQAFQGWAMNLPVALPVDEPADFAGALALLRHRLKIENAERLSLPPWEYRLDL